MQQTPLVSAIIIFWNGEKYLQEAIDSVLSQTYDAWELLLVDDGSTDGSTRIAKLMAAAHPAKVRYLEHEGHANRGMSASRNLGIRHAKGEFVALLDADDVWLPEKLTRQVPILESRPDVGMLYGPTQYWHSWTGAADDQQRDDTPDLGVPLDTQFAPAELMTLVYPLGPAPAPCLCSLLIRRDLLQRVGGFEESFVCFYEDQAFLTKVYLSESVYVSSGCWDRYRIHPDSCSATVERSGQYEEFRTAFLTWLGRYLTSTSGFSGSPMATTRGWCFRIRTASGSRSARP
jgi:glycosyltransferase involved in cell wall biosynthesis